MQLQLLSLTAFQIAAMLDLDLSATPVHLIAGGNGQGKSTIAEAVRFALLGEPTRVSKKSEFKAIIRDGAKTGKIALTVDGKTNSIELPKGTIVDELNSRDMDMLPLVLSPERFAKSDDATRRAILFKLTNTRATAENVRMRLIRRECNPDKIEAALPMLSAGFDAANKEAKAKAAEQRGAWSQLTGENYGSVKAETWQADKPEVDFDGITENETALADAKQRHDAAQRRIGELTATKRANDANAEEIARLTALAADKIERIRLWSIAQGETDAHKKIVEQTRAKAGQKPATLLPPAACLECGSLHDIVGGKLVKHEKHAYDAEAAAALPQQEHSLTVLENAEANLERRATEAKDAEAKLEALRGASGEPVSDADIAAARQDAETARSDIEAITATLAELRAKADAAASADQRTADAKQRHTDLIEWSAIADAFAPDGIPAELLADALKPVNKRLANTAQLTNWAQVMIQPDMSILVDGRPYGLRSESEQWRSDAAIAEAIASLSGLRLFLLDRMDILEPVERPALLLWVDMLARQGDIDTVLIAGTFKTRPGGLPASISVHWIENGELIAA